MLDLEPPESQPAFIDLLGPNTALHEPFCMCVCVSGFFIQHAGFEIHPFIHAVVSSVCSFLLLSSIPLYERTPNSFIHSPLF